MNASQKELHQKLARAAAKFVSDEEAEYFATENIETHIRKSPRTNPLKAAINDLVACAEHKDQAINYKVNLDAFVSIDFHGLGPLVYIKRIHDMLEEKSQKSGIAMAAFTNSAALHTLHAWVQGLAKRGLIAIVSSNGGPAAVVPHNGTKGIFGTNPMAYGIPGSNGEIFCVDMATSEIPYFEVLDAKEKDSPLPERSAVDDDGEFTTDANKALDYSKSKTDPISNIVPMGASYKGYYIVYLLELLTGGAIGMPTSPEMSNDYVAREHGAFMIVMNPKSMRTVETLNNSIDAVHDALKTQKSSAGQAIRIPGESNNNKYNQNKDSDIVIDDELITKLDNLLNT